MVVTCTSLSLDRLKLWSSLKVPLIDDRPLEDNKREQFKKREKEPENTGCKNPINYYATYATGTGSLTLSSATMEGHVLNGTAKDVNQENYLQCSNKGRGKY